MSNVFNKECGINSEAKENRLTLEDNNVDFSLINYGEDNFEAGKLKGIQIAAEESFRNGAHWALKNQWIDVDKEVPEYGESVIGYNGIVWGETYRTKSDFAKDGYDFILLGRTADPIKYWMRIPDLPINKNPWD